MIGTEITREDINKIWSTKDLLGRDTREIMVWNHRQNNCTFNPLVVLSKRGLIPRNIRKFRHPPV